MYTIKWTRLQMEIFRFLCIKAGQDFNLRGIARALRKSPTAVSQALNNIEKEGLVKIKKAENMNLLSIEFNHDNLRAIELKRVENLKLIYESGIVKLLEEIFPGCTIILFGSYSRGEDVWTNSIDKHKSDIDIAIIGVNEKDIDLTMFDRLLERKISINFYKSFKGIHKNLLDNILNGILLNGGVEL